MRAKNNPVFNMLYIRKLVNPETLLLLLNGEPSMYRGARVLHDLVFFQVWFRLYALLRDTYNLFINTKTLKSRSSNKGKTLKPEDPYDGTTIEYIGYKARDKSFDRARLDLVRDGAGVILRNYRYLSYLISVKFKELRNYKGKFNVFDSTYSLAVCGGCKNKINTNIGVWICTKTGKTCISTYSKCIINKWYKPEFKILIDYLLYLGIHYSSKLFKWTKR
jgi:predicted metal-binding protein